MSPPSFFWLPYLKVTLGIPTPSRCHYITITRPTQFSPAWGSNSQACQLIFQHERVNQPGSTWAVSLDRAHLEPNTTVQLSPIADRVEYEDMDSGGSKNSNAHGFHRVKLLQHFRANQSRTQNQNVGIWIFVLAQVTKWQRDQVNNLTKGQRDKVTRVHENHC